MINKETGISLYILMSVIAFKTIHAFIGPYLGLFVCVGKLCTPLQGSPVYRFWTNIATLPSPASPPPSPHNVWPWQNLQIPRRILFSSQNSPSLSWRPQSLGLDKHSFLVSAQEKCLCDESKKHPCHRLVYVQIQYKQLFIAAIIYLSRGLLHFIFYIK